MADEILLENEDTYYWINDLKVLGKMSKNIPYLYDMKKKKWKVDHNNIVTDRYWGYDEDRIGNSDILDTLEGISEEEANRIIKKGKKYYDR